MSNHDPFRAHYPFGAPSFRSEEERLKYDLKISQQRIQELTEIPGMFASIIEVGEKYVTICTGPQTLSVRKPSAMKGIHLGAIVRLQQASNQPAAITHAVESPPAAGPIVQVKQIIDDNYAEIAHENQKLMVIYTKAVELHVDDRVVLDSTGKVIVKNLGRGDKSKVYVEETGVSWDDIGGLAEAKALMIEAIEEPMSHKDLYARYKRKASRGILLHGPEGTGKTMLGKAAATALANVYGASARGGGFLYIKGPDLLNMFVGNSEANIRALFASARQHFQEAGYPAIIFVDEADSLMRKRGMTAGYEGVEKTVVPQFLAEMDGFEPSGCMIILATNRPDTLDPAIVRPGRIDKKIYIGRPSKDESEQIFRIYLRGLPLAGKVTIETVAKNAVDHLFDDKHALYVIRCKDGKDQRFGIKDLASGAIISAITNNASQIALRRERDGQKAKEAGITGDDFKDAIKDLLVEYRSLNHTNAVQDFINQKKLEIEKITAVT